ncbi:unnamed protein product [Arabidopsis arenosa]|uniref:Uncharacterized protein n=1 Tax=Arabidopsis arenosa TaxID=38785 RepID=A0A8S2AUH6_ARAAE|nr:unnamed protein product [Arabidopsis arenosa]
MEEDASFDGGGEFVGGDLTGSIKWCWYNMLRRHNLTAIFCFSSTIANRENLTVELIHRDSPHSPLYNPHHTVSDGLNAAFLRSISRSRRFNTKTDLQSGCELGSAKAAPIAQQWLLVSSSIIPKRFLNLDAPCGFVRSQMSNL